MSDAGVPIGLARRGVEDFQERHEVNQLDRPRWGVFFVLPFSACSGLLAVALYIAAMSEEDWSWMGFGIFIWMAAFVAGAVTGLAASLFVAGWGVVVMTRARDYLSRALLSTALTCGLVSLASVVVAALLDDALEPWGMNFAAMPAVLTPIAGILWAHMLIRSRREAERRERASVILPGPRI